MSLSRRSSIEWEIFVIDGPFIESKECCGPIIRIPGTYDRAGPHGLLPVVREPMPSSGFVQDDCMRKVVGL